MPKSTHSTQTPIRLGFVALADCAPLVMAHEMGLFAAFGLEVELHREVGWATIRDKIIYRELHAAQAPAGLVVGASCGLGSIQADCLTGLILNLHGNAVTLSEALWRRGVRNGHDLAREIALREHVYTFGVVHPYSSHNILLRQWLRAHGIDPNRDVRIVVVPPAQVHRNLKSGHLDGYCVGEPWNSAAVMARTGWCAATSAELAPRHVEKVLMVRRDFAESQEARHLALIAALIEACRYCDHRSNRARIIETLAQPEYVGVHPEALRMSLGGHFAFGHGRSVEQEDFHIFSRGGANEPTLAQAQWLLAGLHSTGIIAEPSQAPMDQASQWFRPDIFQKAQCVLQTSKSTIP